MHPFPLILITSPEDFSDEHVLIEAMFRRGLERLHLRKPRKDLHAMEKWIFELDPEFREHIVVHGHVELCDSFGLAGVHGVDSKSMHSFAELHAYNVPCSYAFLSPIYDSNSKLGYNAAFSEEEIKKGIADWRAKPGHPVQKLFALGGVDAFNLAQLVDWGFDGAAILGAVWNAANPLGAWDALHAARHEAMGLIAPDMPAIESWREVLVQRRGGT